MKYFVYESGRSDSCNLHKCLVVTGICLCIILACASAHFDRGIHWPFFLKLWAISYPLSVWWKLWSECADAWADMSSLGVRESCGSWCTPAHIAKHLHKKCIYPVSILRNSISGRHRPVRVADGPMTARCRFT